MIHNIDFLAPIDAMPNVQSPVIMSETKMKDSFSQLLSTQLSEVNNSQSAADSALQDLALGKTENTHSVMMALQQAKLELQLTQSIRNKLLESYQQIMREQI
ncbi:flagellar hook-basal body complex protein FliE [Cysteiniphilum sp. QT6929]|uniref:flagellar hook-basal body complex protein FliE n=1 Tax=Cysteiniphilum sp. QT6929 TaxID=2975055 RepID=UPI0024B338C4|nr:flagellar hook-basal body complex protein FliE [Cysteiniphilum sp. QT6929]WHN66095.1 flagellar hook-basal body complex protein FliE [Cysteiniphilum sp. QT6929]